jgi:hypothetical protein
MISHQPVLPVRSRFLKETLAVAGEEKCMTVIIIFYSVVRNFQNSPFIYQAHFKFRFPAGSVSPKKKSAYP